jgi:hypothetical protein
MSQLATLLALFLLTPPFSSALGWFGDVAGWLMILDNLQVGMGGLVCAME